MVSLESYNEKALLIAVSKGSETAFRELYDLFYSRITQYAFNICKSREATEELVHDVFIKLWHDRETLDQIQSIEAYMLFLAKNRAIDHLRKRAREHLLAAALNKTEESHNDTEESLNAKQLIGSVHNAISSLSSQKQMVFKLSKLEGWSHDDIAGKMGLSKSTIKNHLSETVRYLRKLSR